MKMATAITVSIQAALDHLQFCFNKYGFKNYEFGEAVIYRLRCLRTFSICSRMLGDVVQLTSLWVRLNDVVRKILLDEFSPSSVSHDAERFIKNIEPLVEEMDKWFIILSDYDLQQRTYLPAMARGQVIEEILGSVVENFKDFLMFYDEDCETQGHFIRPMESLEKYMTFLRNFINFATLLCGDQHQEVQNLFTKIEGLAVSATHLTVYIFSPEATIDRMESISSALQLRIKPSHNPQLYETYSRALASLKHSGELYAPTLLLTVIMDFIDYLLFLPWDILQSDVSSMIPLKSQLETLYDGLQFMRTLLRNLPNMFHGEIRDTARVAICNAGVIIFSLHQNDFVIDRELQDFLRNIKAMQSEFEEKKLNFPCTTVMVHLRSLLDYMQKVTKVDSTVLSCVPKIREDLAFLISSMGVLMELRKHQEDLHEGFWNLGVEVAFKLEFLVHQLVLGNILPSFSPSFLSISADMKIMKTDALKIFDDKRLEKVRGNLC